jgi:hypothetical protein
MMRELARDSQKKFPKNGPKRKQRIFVKRMYLTCQKHEALAQQE